jgi:hypothetical protein
VRVARLWFTDGSIGPRPRINFAGHPATSQPKAASDVDRQAFALIVRNGASKGFHTCCSHQSSCRVRHNHRWRVLTDTLLQAMRIKMIAPRRLNYSRCPGHRGPERSKVPVK